MTQTEAPTLQWGTFIMDFGPTNSDFAIRAAIERFRALLWQVPGQLATVNQFFIGRTGRVVLQVLAVDPDAAVRRAYELGDEEGPEVEWL